MKCGRNKRSSPLLAASETDKPRERRVTLARPAGPIDADAAVADSVSCVVLLAPSRPPNRSFALSLSLDDFLVWSNESALVVDGRSLSFTRRRAR